MYPPQLLFRIELGLVHLLHVAGTAVGRLVAPREERGQATAEYALVLVAAVAVAGLLIAWVKRTNLLDSAMDRVFSSVLNGGD